MKRVKPAYDWTVNTVGDALRALEHARDCLKQADCPKTLSRVRAAISSCKGALRHIQTRELRTRQGRL